MTYERQPSTFGSAITDSVDQMVRLPMKVTEGTLGVMMDGMRWMANGFRQEHSRHPHTDSQHFVDTRTATTPNSGSGSSRIEATLRGASSDQDLRGDDLKYVAWSIVFTKPGFETVLEPRREELVNYEADADTYAAMKIAKFLDKARNGRVDKPEGWNDGAYPADGTPNGARRADASSFAQNKQENQFAGSKQENHEKGWRIPPEDQRFIKFLFSIERRLAREEIDVTRVERVTVERTKTAHSAIA